MIGTRRDIDALIRAHNEYREAYERAFYSEHIEGTTFTEYVSPRKIIELAKVLGLPVRRDEREDGAFLRLEYRNCTFSSFENKEVA